MNPTNYLVGQRVKITKENWQIVHNSNRSIYAYPSDDFVNIVYQLMRDNIAGTVSHRCLPGYEVNVTFDNGQVLQMKDHWITEVTGLFC